MLMIFHRSVFQGEKVPGQHLLNYVVFFISTRENCISYVKEKQIRLKWTFKFTKEMVKVLFYIAEIIGLKANDKSLRIMHRGMLPPKIQINL